MKTREEYSQQSSDVLPSSVTNAATPPCHTHLMGAAGVDWLPEAVAWPALKPPRRPPPCGTRAAADPFPGLASHGYTYTVRKSISPSIMLNVRASDMGTLLNSGWLPWQRQTRTSHGQVLRTRISLESY